MDIRNRRGLKASAAQALAAAPGNPGRTALIYVGASSILALLVAAVDMYLNHLLEDMGGLSNLGNRAILETSMRVLGIARELVLMCWGLGYTGAVIRMARRQYTDHRTLLGGFRRFGPLLRSYLLQALLYGFIFLGAIYAAFYIFMLTPLSNDFMSLLLPLVTDVEAMQNALLTDESLQLAAIGAMWPMYPILLVIFLAVAAPCFYKFRMVSYCLADNPGMGAIAAMRQSSRMMRGNSVSMLKLDLSFWWFYGLQVLLALIANGDLILAQLGVSLPWSDTVSYFGFYIVSLAVQVAAFYYLLNRVETTYATVYETLRPKPQAGGAVLGNIFDLARGYREY